MKGLRDYSYYNIQTTDVSYIQDGAGEVVLRILRNIPISSFSIADQLHNDCWTISGWDMDDPLSTSACRNFMINTVGFLPSKWVPNLKALTLRCVKIVYFNFTYVHLRIGRWKSR